MSINGEVESEVKLHNFLPRSNRREGTKYGELDLNPAPRGRVPRLVMNGLVSSDQHRWSGRLHYGVYERENT